MKRFFVAAVLVCWIAFSSMNAFAQSGPVLPLPMVPTTESTALVLFGIGLAVCARQLRRRSA